MIFLIRERCSLIITAKNKGFMPFSDVNGDEKSFFRFCELDKKTVIFGPAKTTANEGEILIDSPTTEVDGIPVS